jgi:flagellar basal body-associated protein FliL
VPRRPGRIHGMSKRLFTTLVLVLVLAAGVAAYASVASRSHGAAAQHRAVLQGRLDMAQRMRARSPGPLVSLGDEFTVNLADPGLAHFARFAIVLRVDSHTAVVRPGGQPPTEQLVDEAQIRDIVIADASSYSAAQLQAFGGRDRLKARIVHDVAAQTGTLPLAVYFTSFAMQ